MIHTSPFNLMAAGGSDFTTYQLDLTPPCALAQHVLRPLVVMLGVTSTGQVTQESGSSSSEVI
jgi:hypothetical protein